MPIQIKIHGGVLNGDPRGLCNSCDFAGIRETARNDVLVRCGNYDVGPGWIRVPITRCTGYAPRGAVRQETLEKIAWHISVDKKTGKIGFTTPRERALKTRDD